jgi:hypothetical protein
MLLTREVCGVENLKEVRLICILNTNINIKFNHNPVTAQQLGLYCN